MSTFDNAEVVGIVGSPSTTADVVLDIVGDAANRPLVGSMVLVEQEMEGGREVALGTVAEITTRNQWHENTSMRGVIATHGKLLALSGRADVKGADVLVQAVYAERGDQGYQPNGSSLSMSPTTGSEVVRVTDKILQDLISDSTVGSVFYLGDIYRMPGVRMPLNPGEFSGSRGAFHAGVFGPSGVGKSVFTTYYIAGQLRHRDLCVFVIDPQNQFTIERGFTFSLQKLAALQGRRVINRSLAGEIRLPQDKGLFVELLAKTPFFRVGLMVRHPAIMEATVQSVENALEKCKGWADKTPDVVLATILERLVQDTTEGDIYKDVKFKDGEMKPEGSGYRSIQQITQALDDRSGDRWQKLHRFFTPIFALFAEPGIERGSRRTKIEALLHDAFKRESEGPRPLIILSMGFKTPRDADQETIDLYKQLNSESTKARILRMMFDRTERIANEHYQEKGGKLLNTMIVFDEAWRYAPKASREPEIASLADQLAGYARETRKLGVGWMYVLQSPSTLHADVWDQLKSGFRALGYGLTGADLELVRAQVDNPDSIALYRSFTQPSTTNPQYPFMVVGSISPLSFTAAPLFTTVYPTYQQWVEANRAWLPRGAELVERDPESGDFLHEPWAVAGRSSGVTPTAAAAPASGPNDSDLFM